MDGSLLNNAPSDSFMDFDYMNEFLLEGFWVERNELHHSSLSASSYSITDRLTMALEYIKDFGLDKDVLIQIWLPVSKNNKRVLTTSDQPFRLNNNCPRLSQYREISVNFQFSVEHEDSNENTTGLPTRVFLGKLPEWTPNVQFFRKEEYQRIGHAREFDVRGSLAVPVFEQSSRGCLGVVEVVFTSQKIKYLPHLQSICKALEAVNLRGSILPNAQTLKACDLTYQAVLREIRDVFRSACETHRLPLAQTWAPCIEQGKEGCRHNDDNVIHCVSTMDSACYVADPGVQGFHEACSEHHLLKGQGVVGRAFLSNQACFSPDVTSSSKTDYPLSHYAKMFGLQASVAIRLRSISIGSAEFVLEFFLPRSCISPEEHKRMLTSLSIIIQNVCQTLRVVTDQELQQETVRASAFTFSEKGLAFNSKDVAKRGDSKKRTKAEKTITLQILQQYFAGSLKDAAKSIGVCPTTLKRICRQHGIKRWPSRKIKKVGHSLQKIKHVIDSVQGVSRGLQIESFYSNFPELVSPSSTPNRFKNLESDRQHDEGDSVITPSSSCSQSSSSSHCCSTPKNAVFREDDRAMKRVKSAAELHSSSHEPKKLPRCQSHASLMPSRFLPTPTKGRSREDNALRVKVSFGEEKIRLRVQNSWGYEDLMNVVARRFGMDESMEFQLKYLDDDSEWVLLTCDADLQECFDVCRSSQNHTIKLAFHRVSQHR